jgi:hypothetical protein
LLVRLKLPLLRPWMLRLSLEIYQMNFLIQFRQVLTFFSLPFRDVSKLKLGWYIPGNYSVDWQGMMVIPFFIIIFDKCET